MTNEQPRRQPLKFEPEPLDHVLTQEERSQLIGFAAGRAFIFAVFAGLIWFLARGFMDSAEPPSTGIAFVVLIFVVVFFWKRRTYRREMEQVVKDAEAKARRGEL